MKTYQFFLILSTSLAMKKNTPADKAIEHLWPKKNQLHQQATFGANA